MAHRRKSWTIGYIFPNNKKHTKVLFEHNSWPPKGRGPVTVLQWTLDGPKHEPHKMLAFRKLRIQSLHYTFSSHHLETLLWLLWYSIMNHGTLPNLHGPPNARSYIPKFCLGTVEEEWNCLPLFLRVCVCKSIKIAIVFYSELINSYWWHLKSIINMEQTRFWTWIIQFEGFSIER